MPDPAPAAPLLTLHQVADRLHVSVRYVRTLRQSGALPVVRLSPRCLRVRPEDLDRLVEERMANLPADPRRR
jgi:excisionase family DNA binding protein